MSVFDMQRKECIEKLLMTYGLSSDNIHFRETPRRMVSSLNYFFQQKDLKESLNTVFKSDADGIVAQTKIPFKMLCAHHLLPAYGFASVGYIPKGRIVGLSKLCRLVQDAGTYAPSTQEQITEDIINTLDEVLKPTGSIVSISATHTCLALRGANTPGVVTITSAVRGAFKEVPAARQEFFELCNLHSHL